MALGYHITLFIRGRPNCRKMGIENVTYQDQVFGIIIRNNFQSDGITFFTPDAFSQQLAYMRRPVGYVISPHVHNPVDRNVVLTQEVLFIKSGKIRVDFFTDERVYLQSKILNAGDVILLASGGHGFEMLEQSEIIEVKQGPYCGDRDKTKFSPIDESSVRVIDTSI
jgi:hypothetical protein